MKNWIWIYISGIMYANPTVKRVLNKDEPSANKKKMITNIWCSIRGRVFLAYLDITSFAVDAVLRIDHQLNGKYCYR